MHHPHPTRARGCEVCIHLGPEGSAGMATRRPHLQMPNMVIPFDAQHPKYDHPKMVMVVMDTMNMDTINGPQMWDPFDAQHPNYDHPQDGHVGVPETRCCSRGKVMWSHPQTSS